MKTDGIYKFEQQGVFDFCVKEGIIGIGWSRAISKDTFSEEVTNPKEIQTFIWSSSEKWGRFFKWYRL